MIEVKPTEDFCSEKNTSVELEELRVSASPRDVDDLTLIVSGRSAEM